MPSRSIPQTSRASHSNANNTASTTAPSNLSCEQIEELIKEGFKQKGKVPDDVLKCLARREHYIITKEAAWHSVWIETDNFYKHRDHSRDIDEFEEKLNGYRRIQKLNPPKTTAYDVAHKAAEFAEQTFALFVKK